jgi:ABC-type sugar transport system substrate-binding protein
MEVCRWHKVEVGGHGSIDVLDARGADEPALRKIDEELRRQPADMILHLVDGNSARPVLARETDQLMKLATLAAAPESAPKIIGISFVAAERKGTRAAADE